MQQPPPPPPPAAAASPGDDGQQVPRRRVILNQRARTVVRRARAPPPPPATCRSLADELPGWRRYELVPTARVDTFPWYAFAQRLAGRLAQPVDTLMRIAHAPLAGPPGAAPPARTCVYVAPPVLAAADEALARIRVDETTRANLHTVAHTDAFVRTRDTFVFDAFVNVAAGFLYRSFFNSRKRPYPVSTYANGAEYIASGLHALARARYDATRRSVVMTT